MIYFLYSEYKRSYTINIQENIRLTNENDPDTILKVGSVTDGIENTKDNTTVHHDERSKVNPVKAYHMNYNLLYYIL
jgi:hypothetical protein